jgi:hypothetical protein
MNVSNRKSLFLFGALCLISVAVVSGYIYVVKKAITPRQTSSIIEVPSSATSSPAITPKVKLEGAQDALLRTPAVITNDGAVHSPILRRIFFRHNGLGSDYGKLAFVRRGRPEQMEFAGSLSCETVYVSNGKGICLRADRGMYTTYEAQIFDAQTFQSIGSLPLQGLPSRCRISPDGKIAALTVFVSGHSYSSADFSTQTLLVDTKTVKVIADVEKYTVFRDGKPFHNPDFNVWGVTFTPDGKQFYCTLSTNRQHFLIRGDIASQTATVIHEQVECPSLSPDASRIAYKKRVNLAGRLFWRIQILDLRTQSETPLEEERSVDDQLEWLDNTHVLYALSASTSGSSASTNIWVANTDGTRKPELFLVNAFSPSVER